MTMLSADSHCLQKSMIEVEKGFDPEEWLERVSTNPLLSQNRMTLKLQDEFSDRIADLTER